MHESHETLSHTIGRLLPLARLGLADLERHATAAYTVAHALGQLLIGFAIPIGCSLISLNW